MQDDLIIGGDNQTETAHNYVQVLHKLHLANLKVELEKTTIFPESCDVAGWIWKKGGFLEPSPHRKSSLINTKQDQLTKVKHLRSFLGLYKTLHMATLALSQVLAPLEDAVVGKDSSSLAELIHSRKGSEKPRAISKPLKLSIFLIPTTNSSLKQMQRKTRQNRSHLVCHQRNRTHPSSVPLLEAKAKLQTLATV